MFAAAIGLYLAKASDSAKSSSVEASDSEHLEAETCANESMLNPCEDLSNWLSRAGPVPGYHVCASLMWSCTHSRYQNSHAPENLGVMRGRQRPIFDALPTRRGFRCNHSQLNTSRGRTGYRCAHVNTFCASANNIGAIIFSSQGAAWTDVSEAKLRPALETAVCA